MALQLSQVPANFEFNFDEREGIVGIKSRLKGTQILKAFLDKFYKDRVENLSTISLFGPFINNIIEFRRYHRNDSTIDAFNPKFMAIVKSKNQPIRQDGGFCSTSNSMCSKCKTTILHISIDATAGGVHKIMLQFMGQLTLSCPGRNKPNKPVRSISRMRGRERKQNLLKIKTVLKQIKLLQNEEAKRREAADRKANKLISFVQEFIESVEEQIEEASEDDDSQQNDDNEESDAQTDCTEDSEDHEDSDYQDSATEVDMIQHQRDPGSHYEDDQELQADTSLINGDDRLEAEANSSIINDDFYKF